MILASLSQIVSSILPKYFITAAPKRFFNQNMTKNVDNQLKTFTKVCDDIASESGYKAKAEILSNFFKKGSNAKGFNGDLLLWIQMLIPQASQRVYNLQNKQMIKLFGRIFQKDIKDMHEELEQEGDISVVLSKEFESSLKLKPQVKSVLYLQEVDEFLKRLEQLTKEDEQTDLLKDICKKATTLDLRTIIRFIKQDLRINARARHILDALGPEAYEMYQASRDLRSVVEKIDLNKNPRNLTPKMKKSPNIGNINVMTPFSPMLASACKSVDDALKKSPEGLFSEIKYDGERVQIHKSGQEFRFFTRNLKAVMEHKIRRFKDCIPKAFPGGGDMIFDSEIILVDTVTGELLPFGSLGSHKKKEYKTAEECLFIFDCLMFNGESLTHLEFRKRRQILEQNITPIKSIQLSECHFLKTKSELSVMTAKVLKANLEGVVLKNPKSCYQPGKRGWLKVKKDYLFGGKMADTADLVVLGASFGSGKKGGILSIFLMGCYDPRDRLWKTVTKVHSGLDDITNEKIHKKLLDLMERCDSNHLPNWILCKQPLKPDYIAKEPLKMPVWEITGSEFTKSEAHTAGGISIRFPRITKLRDDKSAEHANDLPYLQKLFEASKKDINVDLLVGDCDIDLQESIKISSKLHLNSDDKASTSRAKRKSELEVNDSEGIEKRVKENNVNDDTKARGVKSPTIEKPKVKSKRNLEKSIQQRKLNFSPKKPTTSTDENLYFVQLNAYFADDIIETHKSLIQEFEKYGGKKSTNTKKSNIVFHRIPSRRVQLEDFRNSYNNICHHVHINWLKDSLAAKKVLPFAPYAIILQTKKYN